MDNLSPPRWDLTNVYPGLDSHEFKAAFEQFMTRLGELEAFFNESLEPAANNPSAEMLGEWIDRLNAAITLSNTLRSYIASFVTTDSYNASARRAQSEFEQAEVPLRQLLVRFKGWVGKIAHDLPDLLESEPRLHAHAFMLQETAEQSKYLMSQAEEMLAAELDLSGASAWGKLQGTVTSQLNVELELDGKPQKLPMPALINLRTHPDGDVRKRAYEAEIAAWEGVKEPLAAAMNGVKGAVVTLNHRRGRMDALHSAIDQARLDRPTLEAMLAAMQEALPAFRRYFIAKAGKLGKKRLAWWDLFAPMGDATSRYTFMAAQEFILGNFRRFSPNLLELAERAFANRWIDAEQRSGKRGGAFCMSLPAVKESRVLCNFDGSLEQVFTVAHELGHAYHNDCIYRAGKTELQRITPMTLAETASILCETIMVEAALAEAAQPTEQLSILETALISDSQVIVDIYSRYLFEKEVFERRAQAELSADELNKLMEDAQKAAYGDGLDERFLHKYMWTWKPHYYSGGLSFYNFPYAFGLLFGIGLYAIYQQRGDDFVTDYENLLASTGEANAADLAKRFGIDIRTGEFWQASLGVIEKRIEKYCTL